MTGIPGRRGTARRRRMTRVLVATSAKTLSCSTSRCAQARSRLRSSRSSQVLSTILRPLMPPLALVAARPGAQAAHRRGERVAEHAVLGGDVAEGDRGLGDADVGRLVRARGGLHDRPSVVDPPRRPCPFHRRRLAAAGGGVFVVPSARHRRRLVAAIVDGAVLSVATPSARATPRTPVRQACAAAPAARAAAAPPRIRTPAFCNFTDSPE